MFYLKIYLCHLYFKGIKTKPNITCECRYADWPSCYNGTGYQTGLCRLRGHSLHTANSKQHCPNKKSSCDCLHLIFKDKYHCFLNHEKLSKITDSQRIALLVGNYTSHILHFYSNSFFVFHKMTQSRNYEYKSKI